MVVGYTASDFKRDLVEGDVGEDVKKIQTILNIFGFPVDADETREGRYGTSTRAALEHWRQEVQNNRNPMTRIITDLLLQVVFHTSLEDLGLDFGRNIPIRNYRDGTDMDLNASEAGAWGRQGSTSRAVSLASQFIGQREQGNNCGAVVRKFNGSEGQPWCGGFVNYVMDHAVAPGLFDQKDALSALSYKREAEEHGAFRSKQSYIPKPGDVLVFSRGNGKGHVGIVSDVAADGTVTYIAGNDGDAVRARAFDGKHPPQGLLGYADTHALAAAKGISISPDVPVPSAGLAKATKHSEKSYLLG